MITIKMAFLVVILALVVVNDLLNMIIPNRLLIAGAIPGLVFAVFLPSWSWLLGAIISGGLFLGIYVALPGMLGAGDIKLAALIGLYLGWPNMVPVVFVSIIACTVICLFLVLTEKITLESKVPFAPFLAVGAVATIFFQPQLWVFIGHMIYGF